MFAEPAVIYVALAVLAVIAIVPMTLLLIALKRIRNLSSSNDLDKTPQAREAQSGSGDTGGKNQNADPAALVKSTASEDEDTMQHCTFCGRSFKMEYQYCPFCGSPSHLFNSRGTEPIPLRPPIPISPRPPESNIQYYLEQIGRARQAKKLFFVKIAVPQREKPVTLHLPGDATSSAAILSLRTMSILDEIDYRFSDWPDANPAVPPFRRPESACVCELKNRIYHVEKIEYTPILQDQDTVCLYGCPNATELTNHELGKTVEVIRYDP